MDTAGRSGFQEALRSSHGSIRAMEAAKNMMAALTPFAEFAESPELRMGHPEKVVLESNKGRPSYKRVTVGDFRRALDAMRELEKGPGS